MVILPGTNFWFLDLSGSTNVADFFRNIVFGAGGSEIARIKNKFFSVQAPLVFFYSSKSFNMNIDVENKINSLVLQEQSLQQQLLSVSPNSSSSLE
jgi:hypothetical protein